MERVSVVIAAWNAGATLDRCLASVTAHADAEIEIILVDDASTDGTAERIGRWAERHPRTTALRTPRNVGPSAARNLALDHATGDWIAVVDADDAVAPGRFARMAAVARAQQADICFDNMKLVSAEAGEPALAPVLVPPALARRLEAPWTVESYARMNFPYDSPVLTGFLKPMFRADFLREQGLRYDERVSRGEDYLLIVEALACGAKTAWLDEALYYYYVYKSSLSGAFDAGAHERFMAAERDLMERLAPVLTQNATAALAAHGESLRRAGCTNAVFAALRARDVGALARALWSDRRHVMLHARRVSASVLHKLSGVGNRGR